MPGSVRLSSDTLAGRDEELSKATAALRDLPEARPRVVVVSGPAGIGKTRFIGALTDQLHAARMRAIVGSCREVGAGAPPYSALIAAFRSVDPPAVQAVDAMTGAAELRRTWLFELLLSTTVALALRTPTILIIEDLHWSDRVTRDALLYLVGLAREGRWGLVLTFREDEAAARPAVSEFLEALRRDTVAQITLDTLAPAEVAVQMEGITGAAPVPGDVERMYRRSGGIPLLVEEVLAADAVGISGVLEHPRDWCLARIRRLGAQSARVVEVVAVVGERCDVRLVTSCLGLDRTAAATALDRAVSAGVLVPDGPGFRMRHEQLREAVFGALPPARRRRLHRGVAMALAGAQGPDIFALAHHWYEAADPAEAVQASLDAADLADRVHAPMEVRTYLQRALEYLDALPAERTDAAGGRTGLLARAAEAAFLGGALDQAVALAEACLAHPAEPAQLAVQWVRLARYHWVGVNRHAARHAHERSLALLPADAPPAARAQVLAGYAWYLCMVGRSDDAGPWSERAVAAADESGAPLDRCRALLAWGLAKAEVEAGLDALWQARDLAVQCDNADELGRAHAALEMALGSQGRVAERDHALQDGRRYAAAHGMLRPPA